MPPEIAALIDKPWLLAIVLGAGAVLGIAVERFVESLKRAERRAYWKGRNSAKKRSGASGAGGAKGATDLAADQLRTVMQASFRARPLLNKPERRLLGVIDAALAAENPGWRAMGQVSLGEILSSTDKDAYFAINSKRVDLLIVDADCQPLHAVEFQGAGHHTGKTAAARDAVKKEALRRAGIGYVEVVKGDTPAEVREMVRKLVGRVASGAG
ncbi:DUF2726 domain-containing protein [Parasphingopyxis algicola]|uniref:DUF2726 domain-containing protein n=1 Tax=Parasphingopyxis algicola TaxID=2026624 RepID=UPI0015A0A8E0|nr:DUF2726 domain-containing protein [Parasphingopyxis algicola]QLC25731.1 DUF2726 domain-containing protein [Parasphingopyxis algicola]